jgi:hypothetical protein
VNRRYVLWILACVGVPSLVLFLFGIFIQPLYGDLTRIGLYTERDFGWKKPQQKFKAPAYTQDQYSQYQDVVVLGDSFSRGWPYHQWQNHVIAQTGWSMTTLDITSVDIDKILANPIFQKTPPKIFILESIERSFAERIARSPACTGPYDATTASLPAPLSLAHSKPAALDSSYVARENNWNDVKLEFVWKYIRNAIRLRGSEAPTKVRPLPLTRHDLFSSRNNSQVLVYGEDFDKQAKWQAMPLAEMSCRTQQIRKQIERNGKTRFVLLVPPDKLTAYADFLVDPSLRHISQLANLALDNPAIVPRIDLALKSAIAHGEQDVYLPDDTHWGPAGHKIAAQALLAFLQ